MTTINFGIGMKRLGIEYAIIGRAFEEIAAVLREMGEDGILICSGVAEWLENPPNPLDILSGKQPFPLDAIRQHVEICPSCAIVSELWDNLLHQKEYELELTRKLMAEMTISVEGFEIPVCLRMVKDGKEYYSTWYSLTDEELDFFVPLYPVEIQPILRNREEMKKFYERKSEAKQLKLF